jgi:hypothetical protein
MVWLKRIISRMFFSVFKTGGWDLLNGFWFGPAKRSATRCPNVLSDRAGYLNDPKFVPRQN